MQTISIDMRMVAEKLLSDFSGHVRSRSSPVNLRDGCVVHHYGIFGKGEDNNPEKLTLMVEGESTYTAFINPGTRQSVIRSGDLKEFEPSLGPRAIDNIAWKKSYFDPFVAAMTKLGLSDDLGRNYGVYGLPLIHNGKNALAVWCYPPPEHNAENGLSKIVVRGLVADGTEQDSFFFDSAETFEVALRKSAKYIAFRALTAGEVLDSGTLASVHAPVPLSVLKRLIGMSSTHVEELSVRVGLRINDPDEHVGINDNRKAIEYAKELLAKGLSEHAGLDHSPEPYVQKVVVILERGEVREAVATCSGIAVAIIDYDKSIDDENAILVPQVDGRYRRASGSMEVARVTPERAGELFAVARRGPNPDLRETVEAGNFHGRILSVVDGIVTQRIDRVGTTAKHDGSRLSQPVLEGENADISYKSGLGVVADRGQARGISG